MIGGLNNRRVLKIIILGDDIIWWWNTSAWDGIWLWNNCLEWNIMDMLKVWMVFAVSSILFLMGLNLIPWEVGLQLISKIAELFLTLQ